MAAERPAHYVDAESPYCKRCTRGGKCPEPGRGCLEWREYYMNWWNRNITIAPPKTREVFRYEHPDLVREGRYR